MKTIHILHGMSEAQLRKAIEAQMHTRQWKSLPILPPGIQVRILPLDDMPPHQEGVSLEAAMWAYEVIE